MRLFYYDMSILKFINLIFFLYYKIKINFIYLI